MSNTTDNEPGEALKPCPLAHFVVNGIRFTDFSNEYKSHIWCYDCGLQFEGRVNESRGSVARRWNSRAPLAAVGGDALRNLLNQFLLDKYGCTIEHHRMKVLKHFVEWAGSAAAASSAPAELPEWIEIQPEGEQEKK